VDRKQERAFEVFVAESGDSLLRLATLLTSETGLGEDVYQETLHRLAARWSRVQNPRAFCRQVMHNIVIDQARLKWRQVPPGPPGPPGRGSRHDNRQPTPFPTARPCGWAGQRGRAAGAVGRVRAGFRMPVRAGRRRTLSIAAFVRRVHGKLPNQAQRKADLARQPT
jgi:DNA-directed RNA polymerase specialized sigma24 family protein